MLHQYYFYFFFSMTYTVYHIFVTLCPSSKPHEFIKFTRFSLFLSEFQVFMAAAAFAVKEANRVYINYTTHISLEPQQILVARPKELSRALLFTAPFTLLVILSVCYIERNTTNNRG